MHERQFNGGVYREQGLLAALAGDRERRRMACVLRALMPMRVGRATP